MPYKKEYHAILCPKCGNEYTVLTQAWIRKQKDPIYGMLCKSCRSKVQYEEMSEEQRKEMLKRAQESSKKKRENMTEEEKKIYKEKRSKISKAFWDNMALEERERHIKNMEQKAEEGKAKMSQRDLEKMHKNISVGKKKAFESMSQKERQEWSDKKSKDTKRYWNSMSNEEKYQRLNSLFKGSNDYWSSISPEEKEFHIKRMQDGRDKYLMNLSPEERSKLAKNASNAALEKWNSLIIKEREKIINKRAEKSLIYWKDEENRKRQSQLASERWNNKSLEEQYETIKSLNDGWLDWYSSLSQNERDDRMDSLNNKAKDFWENISNDERESVIRRIMLSSSSKNNLHQYFESRFNELNYDLIPEYPTTNHEVTHSWDYAVFKDNELYMLVDLDGAYFHADDRDYDGMHSKLEYDEKRGLSIPNHVKWCIIYEKEFDKSFAYIRSTVELSYDEFINKRFKEYRSIPFPYPEYTNTELLRSYRDLCKLNCDDKYHKSLNVNTRLGDRLIQHFHRSLYNDIIEVWNDDESLHNMIENGYLYHSYINKNKILQGFNIYEPCKCTQYISAGKAKMIIHRYLNEYDEIFDPCYNYGGIMLACIVMNKRYDTGNINNVQHYECDIMLSFLKDNGIETDVRFNVDNVKHECLFTEVSNDDQIDVCLSRFRCKRYVFVVDETVKYKDNIADIITNKSHFGSNSEYVIIL